MYLLLFNIQCTLLVVNDDNDDDEEGSFSVIYRKTQRQDYPELFNLFSTHLEVV